MPKAIVCDLDDDLLKCGTKFSDRFVYSNYFVPLAVTFDDDRTPILTHYQKKRIASVFRWGVIDAGRILEELPRLGLAELWTRNGMQVPGPDPSLDRGLHRGRRGVSGTRSPVAGRAQPEQEIEFFLQQLRSDVGYLFLDRTRIRPNGFAVGEHAYALSLAPGEEVVLEQKTFTKRQATLEEQTEQEKQFDLELSSTYSTEIQEGLERQRNLSESWGLTLSHTGQYSTPQFPWGQINASHTVGYTRNATEASGETARRSVKDGQSATSKVASKYRALHKTSFKISTEQGFESSSRRLIRNPNRFTPIQLHYFKVLRVLEMMHERYGGRLCWTPSVKDPASGFVKRILEGKEEIVERALADLPLKPVEPLPPPPPQEPPARTKWSASPEIEADKWTGLGVVAMRAEYQLQVPVDSGWVWDRAEDLKAGEDGLRPLDRNLSVRTTGPIAVEDLNVYVSGTPWAAEGSLVVPVHVGAPDGGAGRHIFLQVKAQLKEIPAAADRAREDTKYNDDLAAWRTALKDWNDKAAQAREKGQKEADAWEQEMLQTANPLAEMIGAIVQNEDNFPAAVRDECWEIDLWQKVFEWDRASYAAFPSWWSSLATRDPTREPTHFLNASWAKLYLPIRVGMERIALRWIFGKVVGTKLAKEVEDRFDAIEEDLRQYRQDTFGDEAESMTLDVPCKKFDEKALCLARWTEVLPTDGTHLEVVQGMTSAADPISAREASDGENLRTALIASHEQDSELKKKALERMTAAASLEVKIGPGGQGE